MGRTASITNSMSLLPVVWIPLGAEQRLRLELPQWVSNENPSNGHSVSKRVLITGMSGLIGGPI